MRASSRRNLSAAAICLFGPCLAYGAELPGAASPAAKTQSSREDPETISITVGLSRLISSVAPMQRVSVGSSAVAEATAISPKEVLLNGKAPGATNLILWLEDGSRLFYDVTVQPSRFAAASRVEAMERQVEAISRQISRELPGQTVNVSFEGEVVFLRGRVKTLTDANRAAAIATTMGKFVNLLYVDVPPPEAQILLRVKFASVDRSVSNQLGVNIFSTGATNTVGSITTQQFSPPALSVTQGKGTATLSDALNLFFFRPDLNLGAVIEALQVKGLLQVLAEPNLLTLNKTQANFLAGGEFPFPTVQNASAGTGPTVSIQFREFGVRLKFLPTITPRGTINLQVAPEVSALDFTNGLSVSGFNVPALSVRKLSTEVELSEGQSFAIGGLIDNRLSQTLEKIPFIGDIPVLGKLFQSKSERKQNTELIVIVTPELVRPIPAGQPVPGVRNPEKFLEPNTGKEMRTPGMAITGSVALRAPAEAVPFESLVPLSQSDPAGKPHEQPPTKAPPSAPPAPETPAVPNPPDLARTSPSPDPPVDSTPLPAPPVAHQTEESSTPAPASAVTPDPTESAAPDATNLQLTVQAGSFSKKGNAERLAGVLRNRGYEATLSDQIDRGLRTWHVVRLGPFRSREAASKAASDLRAVHEIVATIRPVTPSRF